MGRLYEILGTGKRTERTRRLWLWPGETMILTPRMAVCVSVDRDIDAEGRGEWIPVIEFAGLPGRWQGRVPPSGMVQAVDWAGLYLTPLALEYDGGRPRRMLVELAPAAEAARRLGA